MCNLIDESGLTSLNLRELLGIHFAPELLGADRIFPGHTVAIATSAEPTRGQRARWGLMPGRAHDLKAQPQPNNLRVESLASSATYRRSRGLLLETHRCIILAARWSEYPICYDGVKRRVELEHPDGAPLLFPGLHNPFVAADGGELTNTAGLITTPPAPALAWVHDRLPAILTRDQMRDWLDPENTDVDALMGLLTPYSGELRITQREPTKLQPNAPAPKVARAPRRKDPGSQGSLF